MSDQVVIRTGTERDVPRILDLLTHYDQPRADFEPWYEHDPNYRPDHSWLLEEGGALVAHLRLYPRRLRLGSAAALEVAGIGNVITAREARGRGHADRLLRAALGAAAGAGFAYSLLWTHLPAVYQRHGFGPAPEDVVRLTVGAVSSAVLIRPARDEDLPAVAALQERLDEGRSGPAVRDPGFWRNSRRWLHDDLLVAERADRVVGYVRRRVEPEEVALLELGVPTDDVEAGGALLGAAAAPREGRVRATLPPSLWPLVEPWGPLLSAAPGLMGRPLSTASLTAVLERVWSPRLGAAGKGHVTVPVALDEGIGALRVTPESVDVADRPQGAAPLDGGELTALILRGCDERTLDLLGPRGDVDDLALLAPARDFVLWPSDRF